MPAGVGSGAGNWPAWEFGELPKILMGSTKKKLQLPIGSKNAVAEAWGFGPSKAVALLRTFVGWIWGKVICGKATATVGTQENQDRCVLHLAGLGYNTFQSEPRLWMDHARLVRSTHQHAQDLGLEMDLLGIPLIDCSSHWWM